MSNNFSVFLTVVSAVALAACSDPNNGEGTSFGGSETDSSTSDSASSTTVTASGGSATQGSGSDSATTGAGSTGNATDSGSTGGFKFDVGGETTGAGTGGACDKKCGFSDWSYVWLANSGEHTISKINTRTLEEEGRYETRPEPQGNPSRTSVSVDGKAVVVANRAGGVTKYWQRTEFCEDKNNNGMIDTSTGKNDVLAFAAEECVAWHTPFPDATTQRPVAWTQGVYNEETCEYDNQQVWTAMGKGNGGTWPCDGSDGIWTYLLNGETGDIDSEIHMPDVSCGSTLGPYGGAVDNEGNLWMYIWSAFTVVHVELAAPHNYTTYSGGSYGITVDTEGRPWVGDSPRRFDLMTKTWESTNGLPGAGGAGIAQDLQGRMWTATQGGVGWVDMETLVVGDTVPIPDCNGAICRGVGVDVDGYIWAVPLGGTTAWKIDPDTYDTEFYDGLNSPYTYSDFAGGQITNVTCNPPAG